MATGGNITGQTRVLTTATVLEVNKGNFDVAIADPLLLNTNVFDNAALGLKIRRLPKKAIRERVDYWLEQFGVSHLSTRSARFLSGGEAQRVSLARAFALEPDVLFLDEPFSVLDAPTKERLRLDLVKVFKSTQTNL